ncbi:SMI1/KNR4 family protein [Verrucomicrobiota bacterium sgz303538]
MTPFSDSRLREIVRFSASAPIEPPEAVQTVEDYFGVVLPETLKRIHWMGGGASIFMYSSRKSYVSCDLHAFVTNPFEYYGQTILTAHQLLLSGLDQSREAFRRVVPFGQDGGESEFCLDYRTQDEPLVAVLAEGDYRLIARSFDEFMDRAFPDRQRFWKTPPNAISGDERRQFLSRLPAYW